MMKRAFLTTTLVAALTAAGLGSAHAQQTFKLTIASSHPPTLPWVGLMSSLFVPEVNKRVAALNKGYKIEWREAYGGQLYKMNATLTSVEQGITDIGWVFHNLEAAKMPLSQFGTVTPFTTDDVRIILDVANEMNEKVPALPSGASWGQVFGVAILCGIGFTMSLFVGSLAFVPGASEFAGEDRMGILTGSILAACIGYAVTAMAS
eukprot:gene28883-50787_t